MTRPSAKHTPGRWFGDAIAVLADGAQSEATRLSAARAILDHLVNIGNHAELRTEFDRLKAETTSLKKLVRNLAEASGNGNN